MNGVPEKHAPAGPTAVRWQIVALLMALSFFSWFHRKSMTVAADERVMKQYDISPEQMGWVYSSLLFTYMLCMTPGGWLIDRFGARAALLFMVVGLAIFGALTGLVGYLPLASPFVAFLLIRSVMGVFATPMYPASAFTVGHWLPFRHRGTANGLVQGSALVGIAASPWLFGLLIDGFDWPAAFLALAALTALLAVVWAWRAADRPGRHPGVNEAEARLIAEDAPPVSPAAGRGSLLALLTSRSLAFLTLSYAAVGYFEYLFYFWMEHYFKEQLAMPDAVRRTYAGVVYLSMAAGMGLGGVVADLAVRRFGYRVGRAFVPVGGMLTGAVLLLAGITLREPIAIVACFSLALAGVGGTEASFWTTAQEVGGKRGGLAAGLLNTGGNLGGLVAPIVTPLVGGLFGWSTAIAVGSAVCLVGLVLWFFIDPRERAGGTE